LHKSKRGTVCKDYFMESRYFLDNRICNG